VSIQVRKRLWFCIFASLPNSYTLHLGGMIFLRFKRIKTALQQGVSLFIDPKDMCTCPLHVLAVALAMHPTPGRQIFPHFRSSSLLRFQAATMEI